MTTPFQYLVFSDLHVNANTLERSVDVLQRIGKVAAAHQVPIVCTGDFWDKRGVLATRQIDAILNEIDVWDRAGVYSIFVPGNHDQVTLSGKIHGMRIFEPFQNMIVATDRLLIEDQRVAFIPWRDGQDQGAQFTLPGDPDWTIFGHAQVGGAASNNGHEARPMVSLAQIQTVSRACYLGHYHKRQKLGDRTWYIGNPFQLHMGERGQPKGVALVASDSIDPSFFDFDDMQKHHRFELPHEGLIEANPGDVVEVVASKEEAASESTLSALRWAKKEGIDLRVISKSIDPGVPSVAVTIADAVKAYTDDPDLATLGLDILATVQHLVEVVNPLGTEARVLRVKGRDFCALSGSFEMDLEGTGPVLVRGPQGAGKTALVDAISWCLYDKTSPRKVAGDTASLRGDDVVNDSAKSASVAVVVSVDGDTYQIVRKKSRGKGSTITIDGSAAVSQDNIDQIVGMPYTLWRSCVSLGQGPVSNFITSTDKHRKALLSDAHGLGVCPHAVKEAKKRLSGVDARLGDLRDQSTRAESVIEHMEAQDFEADLSRFEANRETRAEAMVTNIKRLETKLEEAVAALKDHGGDVSEQLADVEEDLGKAEARLLSQGVQGGGKRAELIKAIGAAGAERSVVDRDRALKQTELQDLIAGSQGKAHGTCPTCSQQWSRAGVDTHIAGVENLIKSKEFEIITLSQRITNNEMSLAGLSASTPESNAALAEEVAELRDHKDKLAEISRALATIRGNKEATQGNIVKCRQELDKVEEETNPFAEKAETHASELAEKKEVLAQIQRLVKEVDDEGTELRFWVEGFGQNGIPVVVLRSSIGDLEASANQFLSELTRGFLWAEVTLAGEALDVSYRKYDMEAAVWRNRRYEQLSGGERRCVEVAFSPLGLSEMLFRRLKCKVPLLVIDELTTHLGQEEKTIACDIIHALDRETVVVIDHDPTVQGEFDVAYELSDSVLTRVK